MTKPIFMQPCNTLPRSPETTGKGNINPADEHSAVPRIDLNEQLVHNTPDTFYLRVNTDCMAGAGICAGDMLIVDRSLNPANGKVIIAMLDGDLLVRFYEKQWGKLRLLPATPALAAIEVDVTARFSVWGVVTYVVRKI